MNLVTGQTIALKIQAALAPFCERIEIAGSIRRQRMEVNDVDLVLLPKPGQLAAIKARCEEHCRVVTAGEVNCIYALKMGLGNEVQIDLFIARPATKDLWQSVPGNFGSLLICRTGSKEHNIWLIEYAKRLGMTWKPYIGVLDGEGYCIAGETEEEIFAALGLEFIPPQKRERL